MKWADIKVGEMMYELIKNHDSTYHVSLNEYTLMKVHDKIWPDTSCKESKAYVCLDTGFYCPNYTRYFDKETRFVLAERVTC